MSAIAVEPSKRGPGALQRGARRALLLALGLVALWGLWEAYRWLGIREGWTWPIKVNDTNMPEISTIWHAFGQSLQPDGPPLRHYLWHYSLFTGKEALAGFALGAIIGFLLAVVLAHSRLLRRGLLPYIIVSQTVPILAIAPMVVVVLGNLGLDGLLPKAIISMYLCFFPVTIGMVKGLRSPDPLQLDLMRTYSASQAQTFRKLRWPAATAFLFTSLKVAIATSLVGAIVGELPTGAQAGLGARLLSGSYYGQTVQIWSALVMASLLGLGLVFLVGMAERLVLRSQGAPP